MAPQTAAAQSPENTLVIEADTGVITIEMLPQIAPKHVEQIRKLANSGAYDGVAFHRVIRGFMAQTGDVQFGKAEPGSNEYFRAGTGGSDMPDIPAEFSGVPYERGIVGMARSRNPNSANSQFFIMFTAYPSLNGQYTVWGQVIDGMDAVDAIAKGEPPANPSRMIRVRTADQR
ncbi:peptidylprolyl isomerase [Rhodovulum sp. DZ06]|uniref:peptidylprolyl isomerase n=1 Tax=Rhodovulum sp. DZ06 TaxID=3425126 RepID=UPI003D32E275